MMEIDVEARSAAPVERVWALLADARTWPQWASFEEAEVEEGEGVGEVRRFRLGRITSRERVTAFEPPRRLGYEFLSGLPIRDYRAEVTLTPTVSGGTDIRWRSTFAAKLPGTGWALRRRLHQFVGETADRLARAAEQNSGEPRAG